MGLKTRLKTRLKKTWIGDVKKKWNRKGYSKDYFASYEKIFYKYSATNVKATNPKYLRLRILICSHSLEKGLCHEKFRAGFGKDVVMELTEMLKLYVLTNNYDIFAVKYGVSILHAYKDMNKKVGFDDSYYLSIRELPLFDSEFSLGVKEYDLLKVNNIIQKSNFSEFSNSRSSVRLFDEVSLPIEDTLIIEAIKLAQNAPNACNRQSVHVHVLKDNNHIKQIEDLQLGCKGFASNAGAFLFVTNDISLYECAEVKLPVFDAGMFTMNLVYALYEKRLLTCVLNASFPGEAENLIRTIVGIPENEMINSLLVVYKIDDVKKIKVPASIRRPVEDICKFVR